MRTLWRLFLLLVLLLISSILFAQATTGTITGTVTSEGKPLPGVTVTIASPALQGVRTTTSGEAGGYSFPNVPPSATAAPTASITSPPPTSA